MLTATIKEGVYRLQVGRPVKIVKVEAGYAFGIDDGSPRIWNAQNGCVFGVAPGPLRDGLEIAGPHLDIVVSAIIFSDGSLLNVPGCYGLRKIVDGNVQLEDNMAKHLKVFRPENELPPEYRAAINDLMDVKFR